jgi:hypothetical protein
MYFFPNCLFFISSFLYFDLSGFFYFFQVVCYIFFPPLDNPLMNLYNLDQEVFEIEFKIGVGHASNRFDMGIEGMKVGSKRIIRLFGYYL